MPAQPNSIVDPEDQATLKLLMDHIDNLEHPLGWIKHPYFQERFAGNPEGVREVKKRFCEALVLLLEKHDKLKKPVGRPRKDASSS